MKGKLFQASKEYLFELQQKHTKTRKMVIGDKMQRYSLSSNISVDIKRTIFKLQCQMEKTKNNYKTSHLRDMSCVFCEKENSIDYFEHYLETCIHFQTSENFSMKIGMVKYADIFGDTDSQIEIAKLWTEIEEQRNLIIA